MESEPLRGRGFVIRPADHDPPACAEMKSFIWKIALFPPLPVSSTFLLQEVHCRTGQGTHVDGKLLGSVQRKLHELCLTTPAHPFFRFTKSDAHGR